jgi:hypothetical protein
MSTNVEYLRKFCANKIWMAEVKKPIKEQTQTIVYKKRARCDGWYGARRIKRVHYARC